MVFDGGADFDGAGAGDGLEDLAVADEDEEGDGGYVVLLANVGQLLGVDRYPGCGWGAREGWRVA